MKIAAEPPFQAGLASIAVTAPLTKSSAFFFNAASFVSSFADPNGHGVPSEPSAATAVKTPPCMSWH